MFVTVITDCKSPEDYTRQATRYEVITGEKINLVGVESSLDENATIESGFFLVSTLDASLGEKGVIVSNVAPRGKVKSHWHNGTPFCYFYHGETLVVASVEGYNLSLIKKLGIVEEVNLVKLEDVLDYAIGKGLLNQKLFDHISKTQFRSYEFIPRLVKWLLDGEKLPHTVSSIKEVADLPSNIQYIDTFGNIKTSLLVNDFDFKPGDKIKTNLGEFVYYDRLKDLPLGEFGMYPGSSGIAGHRFIEIAVQRASAQEQMNLKVGQEIEIVV